MYSIEKKVNEWLVSGEFRSASCKYYSSGTINGYSFGSDRTPKEEQLGPIWDSLYVTCVYWQHNLWTRYTRVNKTLIVKVYQYFTGNNENNPGVKLVRMEKSEWLFQWDDDDEVRFLLDQHAKLDLFHSTSSLKQ
jgi:hypothetical protein